MTSVGPGFSSIASRRSFPLWVERLGTAGYETKESRLKILPRLSFAREGLGTRLKDPRPSFPHRGAGSRNETTRNPSILTSATNLASLASLTLDGHVVCLSVCYNHCMQWCNKIPIPKGSALHWFNFKFCDFVRVLHLRDMVWNPVIKKLAYLDLIQLFCVPWKSHSEGRVSDSLMLSTRVAGPCQILRELNTSKRIP